VKQPIDGLGLSNTSRAAVVGWAKTLAAEVARDAVTVNVVAPGPFETDRMRTLGGMLDAMRATVPAGRVGQPREFGDLVAFLASERAAFITGTTIQIDGGQVRALL
jgi:3-oxoacyl-[acyl-carrier protein] reductase